MIIHATVTVILGSGSQTAETMTFLSGIFQNRFSMSLLDLWSNLVTNLFKICKIWHFLLQSLCWKSALWGKNRPKHGFFNVIQHFFRTFPTKSLLTITLRYIGLYFFPYVICDTLRHNFLSAVKVWPRSEFVQFKIFQKYFFGKWHQIKAPIYFDMFLW